MRAKEAVDDGHAAIAAAGRVGWARPRGVGLCWKRCSKVRGDWCAWFFRAVTGALHLAVVVREGATTGGESSSRPGAEGVLVRAVKVPAEGGFGGFHNTDSLRIQVWLSVLQVWRRCVQQR